MADWLDVALEEYKALRAEILTTLHTQYAKLTFGTAAVGILVGLGFNPRLSHGSTPRAELRAPSVRPVDRPRKKVDPPGVS
jgi:hypothetical protein